MFSSDSLPVVLRGCLDPVTKIQEASREDVAWGVRIRVLRGCLIR